MCFINIMNLNIVRARKTDNIWGLDLWKLAMKNVGLYGQLMGSKRLYNIKEEERKQKYFKYLKNHDDEGFEKYESEWTSGDENLWSSDESSWDDEAKEIFWQQYKQ